jgi:N-methylhydantoinase B
MNIAMQNPVATGQQGRDRITSEVIRQRLIAIPNIVDRNITRTAFSPIVAEYKDYAVGIVDVEGRLISQCKGGITIFVANALGTAVRDGIDIYGLDRIRPDDILITNHAGTMGQHLNNVVMYTPVYLPGKPERPVAFMAVVMHWVDVGGAIVGSAVSNTTTEIWQEGLQLRSVKLHDQGRPIEEMYRVIEYNTRFPRMVLGDLNSQLAGCLQGRDMMAQVYADYGADAVGSAIELLWDQSEAATRRAIRSIANGTYRATSFLDDDGIRKNVRVPIDISVSVEDERITIDFSNIAPQMRGPLNAGRNGGAVAAARVACKYLLTPDEPANEGAFRPLDIVIPEGKFLSARADAAMGGSGSMLPTVIDTIFAALAPAAPDRVAAAHHGTYGIHMFFGRDPETNELFKQSDTATGGWGANHDRDGTGPYRSLVHADTHGVPVEMQEAMNPFRIDSVTLRQDSGGAGRFRGGLGIEKLYTPLVPMQINVSFERTQCPPWGLQDGAPGQVGWVEILRGDQVIGPLAKATEDIHVGDRVRVLTGGGGGFGAAQERDPERVARDVDYGYVSQEAARAVFGVAIEPDGKMNVAETARLRHMLRDSTNALRTGQNASGKGWLEEPQG